jgi:hypothetical protein
MRKVSLLILEAALAGVMFSSVAQAAQQSNGPRRASESAFDPRDFSGHWHRMTPGVTFGIVPDGQDSTIPEAPFTPEGKTMFDANEPGYGPRSGLKRNDPLGRCEPLGLVRHLNAEITEPHPTWQIVQTPNRILQFFEYRHDWREIWMDGRSLPDPEEVFPKWNGYSVGHFEGDTLVVETVGLDERSWLDKWGYPKSEQIRVVERYRRLDADTLELRVTITDPLLYTRPWEGDRKLFRLNREKASGWDEQIYCVPSEEFAFQELIESGNVIGSQK